jgi:hypothetical protein
MLSGAVAGFASFTLPGVKVMLGSDGNSLDRCEFLPGFEFG